LLVVVDVVVDVVVLSYVRGNDRDERREPNGDARCLIPCSDDAIDLIRTADTSFVEHELFRVAVPLCARYEYSMDQLRQREWH
jgi:hypothetical protein